MSAKQARRLPEWDRQSIAEMDNTYVVNARVSIRQCLAGNITKDVLQRLLQWQINAAVRRARV